MTTDSRPAKPAGSLCSLGPRPQLVTGYFVELFRMHFSNPNSLENTVLQKYPWTPDPLTSGVLIEDATTWTPDSAGERPSIVVKRERWQPVRRAVNNQSGVTLEGHVEYSKVIVGAHSFFCISREGPEAEQFSTEVWRYVMHFESVIRASLGLLRFDLADINSLGQLEEASDRYAVPVVASYSLLESWVLKEHSPLLKVVRFGPQTVAG